MRKIAGVPLLLALAGCAPGTVTTAPTPVVASGGNDPSALTLREEWRSTVVVNRTDSIILTLPSGAHQTQRYQRRAVFSLEAERGGGYTIRLDSLSFQPAAAATTVIPVGAKWGSRNGDSGVRGIRLTEGGDTAAELTAMVRGLLPRLPAGGVKSHSSWTDSTSGSTRVDIFNANERRRADWTAGAFGPANGGLVLPIHLHEEFEQVGGGSDGGKKISMTSQGSRSGTYYVAGDGRVMQVELTDSAQVLISIPSTKEMIPTIRHTRTSIRFLPAPREHSE